MNNVAVLNIVGLTERLLGSDATPFLNKWSKNRIQHVKPLLPAVTCSVQATYLTGKWPNEHGIIGNGWFHKDYQEIKFWHQSNKLIQSPLIWDELKRENPEFTCANMFWWFNMYSSVDYSVTPRPQYRSDGLKIPDCYSEPANLRDELQTSLGQFPLFNFWGPKTSIKSSEWIADASLIIHDNYHPNLMFIYIPHLDYVLQKYGPNTPECDKNLQEIDDLCKKLINSLESDGRTVIALSEYGITPVNHPIHINRTLRELGYLNVRVENGKELLDAGASDAFAVCDHQIAHIYIKKSSDIDKISEKLAENAYISTILAKNEQKQHHINHDRAGDLILVSQPDSWFSYYYWENDEKAPDFARTVAIHNKPGYDPIELFFDPKKRFIYPRLISKLIKKKLGFRTLMDVIPLEASLAKGSHGQLNVESLDEPIIIGSRHQNNNLSPIEIKQLLKEAVLFSN